MKVPKAMIERVEEKFIGIGNRAQSAATLVRQEKVRPPSSGDLARDLWTVEGRQVYTVSINFGTCPCPDFRAPVAPRDRGDSCKMCKHMIAAMFYLSLKREADAAILDVLGKAAKLGVGTNFDMYFDSFFGQLGTRRFIVFAGYKIGDEKVELAADDRREVNIGRLEWYMKRHGVDMRARNDHKTAGSIQMIYPMTVTGDEPLNLHWLYGISQYAADKRERQANALVYGDISRAIAQYEDQLVNA